MRRDSSLRNTEKSALTDAHLNFTFQWALHFNTSAIKLFNRVYTKLQLLPHHSLLLNAYDTLIFKTKALGLVSNVQYV